MKGFSWFFVKVWTWCIAREKKKSSKNKSTTKNTGQNPVVTKSFTRSTK